MSSTAEHQSRARNGDGFRWRSHEVMRIEGVSDAVFGFAVTLLIVSLEVPRTFHELAETMRGFIPFAVSFAMLFQIWYAQHAWFRRYALQDGLAVVLNGALLFLVLFYVYPLKFLFTFLYGQVTGREPVVKLPNGHVEEILARGDAAHMMMIYDAGFIAIFGLFVLMYLYAWHKRDALRLDIVERFKTREAAGSYACMLAVGLLSLTMVTIGGDAWAGRAGFTYILLGPLMTVYHAIMGRRSRKLVGF